MERNFLCGMGGCANHTSIVSIHENTNYGPFGEARLGTFQVFRRMMETKCSSNYGNVKFAWYATSKGGITEIINHGFSNLRILENDGVYGVGVYLSPHSLALESVKSSINDEDGLNHVLLCEVILGNMEEVRPGSNQCFPSSEIYDTGVDNLQFPRKHIIWSTIMNSHIMPKWVVSFRIMQKPVEVYPCSVMRTPIEEPFGVPFIRTLLSALSKFLPLYSMVQIRRYASEHQEGKLSRDDFLQHVKDIGGETCQRIVLELINRL